MRARPLIWGVPVLIAALLLGSGVYLRTRSSRGGTDGAESSGEKSAKTRPVLVFGPAGQDSRSPALARAPKPSLTLEEIAGTSSEREFGWLFASARSQALVEVETLIKSR